MHTYCYWDLRLTLCYLILFQGVATGKYHAAHLTNDQDMEVKCKEAGMASGDLSFPLVYCPELHFSEFSSAIADMKNSVAVSLEILRSRFESFTK